MRHYKNLALRKWYYVCCSNIVVVFHNILDLTFCDVMYWTTEHCYFCEKKQCNSFYTTITIQSLTHYYWVFCGVSWQIPLHRKMWCYKCTACKGLRIVGLNAPYNYPVKCVGSEHFCGCLVDSVSAAHGSSSVLHSQSLWMLCSVTPCLPSSHFMSLSFISTSYRSKTHKTSYSPVSLVNFSGSTIVLPS